MSSPGLQDRTPASAGRRPRRRPMGFVRPRFLNELAIAALQDEVIVDGTEQFQVFQGGATGTLLPRLIPLMDGTRTPEELAIALPDIPAADVIAAISLLGNSGLAEEGAVHSRPLAEANPETLAFFRRYLSVTHSNRSGQEALQKLQSAQVMIAASNQNGHAAEVLKTLLEKTGMQQVRLLQSLDGDVSPARLVVSLCFGREDRAHQERLDEWCRQIQLPWLRVAIDPEAKYADIGPLFNGPKNACYRCFLEVHGRPSYSEDGATQSRREPDVHFWTSVAATEIIYFFTRIAPSTLSRDFRRYDVHGSQLRQLRWPRVPGCAHCRPYLAVAGTPEPLAGKRFLESAVVFEDYVGLPSLSLSSPKKGRSSPWAGLKLTLQSKRLENCTSLPLNHQLSRLERPVLDVLSSTSLPSRERITLDELSTLLLVTAGIRGKWGGQTKLQRWASTAGNLGSVELFVAARNVEGLEPGFYFYQPREHSLAAFRRRGGRLTMEEFFHRSIAGTRENLPDALVLFTGAFHRVSRKYGAFGYRLINMDAGAAMSQLHLAARSLGAGSRTGVRWADDLVEAQLNLDPPHEQVTGVVELFTKPGERLLPDFKQRVGCPGSAKPPSHFHELPVQEVFHQLYWESRTKENEMELGAYAMAGEFEDPRPELQPAVRLPAPMTGGRFVGDILPRRTSIRRYSPDSVALEQLASMLHCARVGDVNDWPDETQKGNALEFVVLAWRVSGVDAGVYSYLPSANALAWLAPIPAPAEAANLFVQPEFATAPVVVWIAGDLAQACSRHGAFGHRQLLLRAGAAAHRMWMAAMAMGSFGAITAGLVPGEGRRLFAFNGYWRASLLACASGTAASSLVRQSAPEDAAERH